MKPTSHNFYTLWVKPQIHVSLCATALCGAVMLWNQNWQWNLLGLIFFSTLFSYNWAIYRFEKREKFREWSMVIAVIIATVFAFFSLNNLYIVIALLLLSIPTLLYNHALFQIKFRTIPLFKLFLIASVWAGTIVVLPWLNTTPIFSWKIIIETLAIFLFVIGITIPFDIRDLQNDQDALMTLPQKFGLQKSKRLAYSCLLFSFILVGIIFYEKTSIWFSFLCVVIVAILGVYKSNPLKPKSYYSFWVESISLLPLATYLLFKIILN